MLYTVYDKEDYFKHRIAVQKIEAEGNGMRARMNRTDHFRVKPEGKTKFLVKERNAEIEHDNRLLFKKIEAIINR